MKQGYLISLLLIACTISAAAGYNIRLKQAQEVQANDFKFMNKVMQTAWNGFLRGYYRDTKRQMIDQEQCFGPWVDANIERASEVVDKLSTFSLSYQDAEDMALGLVDIVYKNFEYCGFESFYRDNYSYLLSLDNITDDFLFQTVLPNIQNNMLVVGSKVVDMVTVLSHAPEQENEDETLSEVDRLGEDYGTIISYIIGFQKK